MRALNFAPVVALFAGMVTAQEAADIRNWPSPPFWTAPADGTSARMPAGLRLATISKDAALTFSSAPLPFVAMEPCRLIDTRLVGGSGITGQWGPPSLVAALVTDPASFDRVFTFTGAPHCTIPAGAQGVSAYITTINYTANGRITAYPAGTATRPGIATLNYRTAAGIGVTGEVIPLSASGQVSVFSNQNTDLVVDVNGYYAPLTRTQAVAANPQQIAVLKWYPANETGATFTVGGFPSMVAFDGANIWLTVQNLNNVTKLRASDGVCVAPCTFPVGRIPTGVAFDGTHIWVANNGDGTVTKLRASDGACVGKCTFTVGTRPAGVAFDGANIWVANVGSNNVSKIRASDGFDMGTFAGVGAVPIDVAFDGTSIWVTSASGVTKLRAFDGVNLGTFSAGLGPIGVAFDGANIWVANEGSTTVTKLRASDGANLGTFTVGTSPIRVAFDGANVWVVNRMSNDVTKLRASDGANLGTFSVGSNPIGVAFDGANIWVTNSFSANVSKL